MEYSKLEKFFVDANVMSEFMNRYFSQYETEIDDIDLFGWDSVADDIESELNSSNWILEGEYLEIEIPWYATNTGNPELVTVGECVETPTQVAALRELGCSQIQGCYSSKPLSLSDLAKQLHQTNQS